MHVVPGTRGLNSPLASGMRRALVLAAAALLLLGCYNQEAERVERIAQDATDHFHEQLSAGQFDEIYRTSDPELRRRQSASTFIVYLRDAQARLATAKSRRQFHTGVVLQRDHATVVLAYDVDVGDAIVSEQISWVIREQATLSDYYIETTASR